MSEGNRRSVTVILVILGVLFLVPGACGSLFFAMLATEAMRGVSATSGDAAGYTLLVGTIASGSVLLSLILLGVIMRAGSWAFAKAASLVIALVGLVFVVVNHIVFMTLVAAANDARVFVYVFTAVALGITCLPPYLHWRSGR